MQSISEIMERRPQTVRPDDSAYDVARTMHAEKNGCVVVVVEGKPVGVLTRRDMIREVVSQEREPKETLVKDIMITPVVTISNKATLARANKMMKKRHLKQMPVVDNDMLAGLLLHDHITYAIIDMLDDLNSRAERIDITVDEFHRISEQFYLLDGHLLDDPGKVSKYVSEVMNHNITIVPSDMNVLEASKIMGDLAIGCLIVRESGKPLGIVTEKDMVVRMLVTDKRPTSTKISEIMSKPLLTIPPEMEVYDLGVLRKKKGFTKFPVMDNGMLVGIVTQTDLLHASLDLVKFMHWKILEKWDI